MKQPIHAYFATLRRHSRKSSRSIRSCSSGDRFISHSGRLGICILRYLFASSGSTVGTTAFTSRSNNHSGSLFRFKATLREGHCIEEIILRSLQLCIHYQIVNVQHGLEARLRKQTCGCLLDLFPSVSTLHSTSYFSRSSCFFDRTIWALFLIMAWPSASFFVFGISIRVTNAEYTVPT